MLMLLAVDCSVSESQAVFVTNLFLDLHLHADIFVWPGWYKANLLLYSSGSSERLVAPAKLARLGLKLNKFWTLRTIMWIHLYPLFLTLFNSTAKKSSQTMNFSLMSLKWSLGCCLGPQQNSRHEALLTMSPNRNQSTVAVSVKSLHPPFSPPYNRAHPQSTYPLPALDQQTWEASPPGLESRMNTMINMFSRPLVFMTLTFNNLLMTSG